MASLHERKGSFRISFRYHGKQWFVPIGKVTRREAEAKKSQAEYLLMRLDQGLIQIPAGFDVGEFVQYDGKPPERAVANLLPNSKKSPLTLGHLRDRYLEARSLGSESSTLYTSKIHFKHLVDTYGESAPIAGLRHDDLQKHVRKRADMGISATTIKKEIATLRSAWRWALHADLIEIDCPNKGLVYPKEDELPPYQTMDEIQRRIEVGRLDEPSALALWDSLYLRPSEIAELLEHVRTHARHPWIYPLACLAAHTGARRSELTRLAIADVDFEGKSVTIHEKKRVKGKRSTRLAPLTPVVLDSLREWLKIHPGGQALFCHLEEVAHSKKRSPTTGHRPAGERPTSELERMKAVRRRAARQPEPLTVWECHDHFKRTLVGSKWSVVKGLHTLRHSVASSLAAAGVDQRIIDDMLGHVSEDMKRRYRHLTPELKTQAVAKVFGHTAEP